MTHRYLRAPFPYFGGKSRVAHEVWAALGSPRHYIEPFFGSGAVLLARQHYDPMTHVETVCDKDGYVANVWRALQRAPDEVARYCDWPVNHADLAARRNRLLRSEGLLDRLIDDDEYYDARLAGYWIWCTSCWIGDGLTTGSIGACRIPHISDAKGVHSLSTRCAARASNDPREPYSTTLYTWFRALSERLRYVRVVCGDWTRVCGGDWQDRQGIVGIFFDPPYGVQDRDTAVYRHDDTDVAHAVREWCIERGARKTYRIVLAGYDEHAELVERHGWRVVRWRASGGYANPWDGRGRENRERETLYISPYCVEGGLV